MGLELPVTQPVTPYGSAKFTESNHFAQQNNVRMQSVLEGVGTVTQRDGQAFQVNLEAATCSCKRYQDTLFPCRHEITVMHRLRRAPIEYIPTYAKRETWITAYTHKFPSINLADVELVYSRGRVLGDGAGDGSDSDSGLSEPPLSDCEPPLTRATRGRPSNKRKRKGDGPRNLRRRLVEEGALPDIPNRAPPRCSSCKNLGHCASNCTRPHT